MVIKNKIGCIDKTAKNYDSTAEIACKGCCFYNEKQEAILTQLTEITKNKNLDLSPQSYASYAVGYIDYKPVFVYQTQAEKYAKQIGCEGSHEHEFNNRIVYMACKNHDLDSVNLTSKDQINNDTPCEEYMEGVTTNGIVIWSNITTTEKQKDCCGKKEIEGYVWDDLTRKCYVKKQVDEVTVGNRSVLGFISNVPVWYTVGAAKEYATIIGCSGYHKHTIGSRTGFMACESHSDAMGNYAPKCFDTKNRTDGSLVFNNTETKNDNITNRACCQQWREYGFIWDGLGCKQLDTPLTWNCIDGLVTEIYDGNGYYQNFSDALTFCESNSITTLSYDCVNNSCEVNPVGEGQYSGENALTECLANCNDCYEKPICCDTEASNCDSKCQIAAVHKSCGCDNTFCVYNLANIEIQGSQGFSLREFRNRIQPIRQRMQSYDGPNPLLPGDLNNDGIVNLSDLNDVISNWLETGIDVPGDYNQDGIVNLSDLNNVISNWLETGPVYIPQPTSVPGCPQYCLAFDIELILTDLISNAPALPGTGIWRTYMGSLYNIWSLGNANDYMSLYDGNTNLGVIQYESPGASFSYTIHQFNNGVLSQVNNITTAPTLQLGSYVIKVVDNTNTDPQLQTPCEHNYSFSVINPSGSQPIFQPSLSAGGEFCNIWGCTEAGATNYTPAANANNNSCIFQMSSQPNLGCTDPAACNYDPLATSDNGSCNFDCYGCTDQLALNFSVFATLPCNGNYGNFCDVPGVDNCCCEYQGGPQPFGCTDNLATNYDPLASIDDGSCQYITDGCTNPLADNFDPNAIFDDGTCEIPGCIDDGTDINFPGRPSGYVGTASNYNPDANIDDGSCIYVECEFGCTDPTATNYNPDATCDDDSCYGGCCATEGDGVKDPVNYILTGFTKSKINQIIWPGLANPASVSEATTDPDIINQYGVNPYYPLKKRVPSKGIDDGWTIISEKIYTAYTINNIHYWDYATTIEPSSPGQNVITRFAVQMTNCCPGCLYPDIKQEWRMGHVFPEQIENNVFIDRGQISVFEEYYRILEVKRIEDFDNYQGGYFNIIN